MYFLFLRMLPVLGINFQWDFELSIYFYGLGNSPTESPNKSDSKAGKYMCFCAYLSWRKPKRESDWIVEYYLSLLSQTPGNALFGKEVQRYDQKMIKIKIIPSVNLGVGAMC